jgi:hypothetical protein
MSTVIPTPPAPPVIVAVTQTPWWTSKTVWLNVLTMVVLLPVILSGVDLNKTALEIIGVIVAASNVALRLWFTGGPVTDIGTEIAKATTPQPDRAIAVALQVQTHAELDKVLAAVPITVIPTPAVTAAILADPKGGKP